MSTVHALAAATSLYRLMREGREIFLKIGATLKRPILATLGRQCGVVPGGARDNATFFTPGAMSEWLYSPSPLHRLLGLKLAEMMPGMVAGYFRVGYFQGMTHTVGVIVVPSHGRYLQVAGDRRAAAVFG